MTDQQRADCLADHPMLRTPNLDRIAAAGTRFLRAHTVSPVCMPARSSFISGVYPHNHCIWYNAGQIPREDETFLHHLKRSGYYTGHVGKAHYYNFQNRDLREWEPYMHARGFDFVHESGVDYISGFVKNSSGPVDLIRCSSHYSAHLEAQGLLEVHREDFRKRARVGDFAVWPSPLPEDDFVDGYIGARAVEFIERYDRQHPFFLFVGFHGPHYPWNAPGRFGEMYDPQDLRDPTPGEPVPEGRGSWVEDLITSGRLPDDVSSDTLKKAIASYYGKISLIDDRVGRILNTLERRGMRDNTVVIFTSDHGEMAGDHGRLNKRVYYEESVLVPLLISHPGFSSTGVANRALVDNLDLYPTLLEIAGCEPSKRCMGRSLVPLLGKTDESRSSDWRDEVFSEVSRQTRSGRMNRITMVRTDRFKYAMDDLSRGYMLFDMKDDPGERANLVGDPDYYDVEEQMRQRILRYMLRTQYAQYFPGARTK